MFWFTWCQVKFGDDASRRKAAESISRAPTTGNIGLLRILLHDKDAEVRRLAVTGFSKLDGERRLAPLLEAVRDQNPAVVMAAVAGLKGLTDGRVNAALVPLLRHADPGARTQAAKTLKRLGWLPSNREDEIAFLVAKGEYARAVLHGSVAIPALEASLAGSAGTTRMRILEALGRIGGPRVFPALVEATKSNEPMVCLAAVDALSRSDEPGAAEAIVEMLRHNNAQVRAASAEALGKMRASNAAEPVIAALGDSQWDVRREAAEALGRIRDPKAVEPLGALLNDADADVREAAVLALGNFRDRRSIGPLVLALKDSTSSVRRIAAGMLSRIDSDWSSSPEARAAIEKLKTSLNDEDLGVRHFVNQLLINLGAVAPDLGSTAVSAGSTPPVSTTNRRKLAISLFIGILDDQDNVLRQAAAEALGRIGDESAWSALGRMRGDPDASVRNAVSQALHLLAPLSGESTVEEKGL